MANRRPLIRSTSESGERGVGEQVHIHRAFALNDVGVFAMRFIRTYIRPEYICWDCWACERCT